jgi:hypothetical protein
MKIGVWIIYKNQDHPLFSIQNIHPRNNMTQNVTYISSFVQINITIMCHEFRDM